VLDDQRLLVVIAGTPRTPGRRADGATLASLVGVRARVLERMSLNAERLAR